MGGEVGIHTPLTGYGEGTLPPGSLLILSWPVPSPLPKAVPRGSGQQPRKHPSLTPASLTVGFSDNLGSPMNLSHFSYSPLPPHLPSRLASGSHPP